MRSYITVLIQTGTGCVSTGDEDSVIARATEQLANLGSFDRR